jgi:alpha-mannosidase
MTEPDTTRPAAFRPKRVHVVSHTHWDREWYLTFQEFRVNLTHVVKQVLDALENDPDFDHFLLDGQAIVLEDHLQVCPEDEERIKRHVASGALQIGPWYMLPDEFLVSGESLVRNLLVGSAICARFGGAQSVGYMADSFGHPAQIPQILAEGGLDSFVYTRGNGSELEEVGHEYLWQAPDGSRVTAIQQCGGYCAGAGLGH